VGIYAFPALKAIFPFFPAKLSNNSLPEKGQHSFLGVFGRLFGALGGLLFNAAVT
jgi:hypothetical protein